MFWSRTSREARRQKVLDELLELDPRERQASLELAVAAGDVRANEVEETLRLVRRLDALRGMTIGPKSEPTSSETLPEVVPSLSASSKPAAARKVRKARGPFYRATRPGQEPGRSLPESSAVPIQVVVTSSRLIDRELAAHRVRSGSFSSHQRRLRLLAQGSRSRSEAAPISEGAPDHRARVDGSEPSSPDISWLRP